ncbi:hypothetical protein V6N13_020490 [Hibiscus sabdariffa]
MIFVSIFNPDPISIVNILLSLSDLRSERNAALVVTDDANDTRNTLDAIWSSENEDPKHFDPLIIIKASSLARLPLESSYVDHVILIYSSIEVPVDELYAEIFRVLTPGGKLVVYRSFQSETKEVETVLSAVERKLLLAEFLDGERFQLALAVGIKAKKPPWKIGSSFAIKKSVKNPLKIQMDDELDLIDEDSLLTEEDLKKPQLPTVDDYEVGSTRKACTNCTCGRAEQEEKVQKLDLTADQLNNPQSACGNVMHSAAVHAHIRVFHHSSCGRRYHYQGTFLQLIFEVELMVWELHVDAKHLKLELSSYSSDAVTPSACDIPSGNKIISLEFEYHAKFSEHVD